MKETIPEVFVGIDVTKTRNAMAVAEGKLGESPRKITGFKSRIFSSSINEEILMKKSRFSEAQILSILRQTEGGVPVPDLAGSME
jgi:hypothetical protein